MPSNCYHIIGLMSGTSLDGLDVAHCKFNFENNKWLYEIIDAKCYKYSAQWVEKLQNAPSLPGRHLTLLGREYGFYLAEKVTEFIAGKKVNPQLISSHGHTIYHDPKKYFNLQIGDGAALFAATKIPVVCDLRSVDICSGGQGAPLVPIGDKLLFNDFDFCLNLGGIANISFDDESGDRIAYDISPCNLILNSLADEDGKKYDEHGEMARNGNINPKLLQELNSWKYYAKNPPKSLDKDALLNELMPLFSKPIELNDKMATAAEHIAHQIANSIKSTYKGGKKNALKMLVTGGGAFNKNLVELIRQKLENVDVIVPDDNIVEYKEALIFAFLGLLRVLGKKNTLATVTGAESDTIGGALYGHFVINN